MKVDESTYSFRPLTCILIAVSIWVVSRFMLGRRLLWNHPNALKTRSTEAAWGTIAWMTVASSASSSESTRRLSQNACGLVDAVTAVGLSACRHSSIEASLYSLSWFLRLLQRVQPKPRRWPILMACK